MKADKLVEALIELAREMGYSVRREQGKFKGGACVVREQRLILINRSVPYEAAAVVLARAIAKIGVDDQFLKPKVREILERESIWVEQNPDITFELAKSDNSKEETSA